MKKILLFTLCAAFALCIGNLSAQNNAYLKNVSPAEREIAQQNVAKLDAVSFSSFTSAMRSAGTRGEEIFYEPFEFSIPSTWINLNVDGDAYSWKWEDPNASPVTSPYAVGGCVSSASWQNNVVLYPDNWLISPPITLNGEGTIQYYVAAQDPGYPQDHYGVYVSYNAGTTPADFTLLYEETLYSGTWTEHNIPVTGTEIRIAFRHFDCSDWFVMKIDEVKVFFEGAAGDPCPAVTNVAAAAQGTKVNVTWTAPAKGLTGYEIYQGSTKVADVPEGTTEWTSDALASGTYTFAVAAIFAADDDCIPVQVAAAPVEIKTCNGVVTNLAVAYAEDCGTATITWDAAGKGRAAEMLWDNTAGMGTNGYHGTAWIGGTDRLLIADDFIVPDGERWSIQEIFFYAFPSSSGSPQPEHIGIMIYEDNGNNRPKSTSIFENNTYVPTGGIVNGEMTIVIPEDGIEINEGGKYWISIYGAYDGATNTSKQYYVGITGTPKEATMCRWDSGDLYGGSPYHPDWAPNEDPAWPSMGFSLSGEKASGPPPSPKYNVYRDGEKIAGPLEEVTTFEDKAFDKFAPHTWSVAVACSNGGDGEWADAKKDACQVSIMDHEMTFSIFPNPANNDITIKSTTPFNKVEIVNFLGQTVISQNNNGETTKIDVSNLNGGIYFVRIITETATSVQKFVKK